MTKWLKIISCIALSTVTQWQTSAVSAPADSHDGEKPIAARLQPYVDRHALAGAVVLVASKDKILDLEAVGYSDVAAKTAMRPDDLFWIASMSKAMTASALMMLVDEGKVNVEDPVEKYLPEFRGQMVAVEQDADHVLLRKPRHPITVRNILTHTSGLPFMSRVEHHIDQLPLREAVMSYALSPLKFEPDSKYDYSNAGINTAGRIVEVVSGMPYEQFMRKRLFDPLGMKETTFWPTNEQVGRLAKSYKPDAARTGLEEIQIDQLTYPLTSHDRYPCPAGGLFSTAADVSKFCQMLLNGGTLDGKHYLSQGAVRQMTSTQTNDLLSRGGGENGYGFGLSTTRRLNKNSGEGPGPAGACGHGGAYATDMWIDPERGLITVYMVQHAGFPGDGNKAISTFKTAAQELFAAKK